MLYRLNLYVLFYLFNGLCMEPLVPECSLLKKDPSTWPWDPALYHPCQFGQLQLASVSSVKECFWGGTPAILPHPVWDSWAWQTHGFFLQLSQLAAASDFTLLVSRWKWLEKMTHVQLLLWWCAVNWVCRVVFLGRDIMSQLELKIN